MEVLLPHMGSEREAFSEFLSSYPSYRDTMAMDSLRHEEYPHLDEKGQICVDYTGVGVFSSSQKSPDINGGLGIGLSYTSANLATHAMYTEDGSTESIFRKRILRYLNLDEDDYYIVFTANGFSAFKLLGESYPFHEAQNLLLAYDHQCENLEAIRECAQAKAAPIQSATLSYPWLKIDADDLRKKLQGKRKVCTQKAAAAAAGKGLFAYPYSSRVTGRTNSSQWISKAHENGWHVLLDVTCIDAKMMDTLGLSVFMPDFLICSFYNVFGEDPTGFGCLVIKKSVLRTLGDSSRARAIGMVNIVTKQASSSSPSDSLGSIGQGNDSHMQQLRGDLGHRRHSSSPMHSLSFQPGWSADVVATDNIVLYRSNGDCNTCSKALIHGDRAIGEAIINNKGSVVEGLSGMDMDAPVSSQEQGSVCFLTLMPHLAAPSGSFRARENGEEDDKELSAMNLSRTSHNQDTSFQTDMFVSTSRHRSDSEIEEIESMYSHSTKLICFNGGAMQCGADEPLSRRRSVKGLFDGDFGAHSPDCSSSKGFSKHDTKPRTESRVQKASCIHHGEEATAVNDWRVLYARKAKLCSTALSNTSSSVSAPTSPSRSGVNDAQEKESWPSKSPGQSNAASVGMEMDLSCKGLDHADMLGYKIIAIRLRNLANWLISSLSRLRHPQPENSKLVRIYSSISPAEHGSTVALTLLDSAGKAFDPKRVQMLADRSNISLRTGIIKGTLSTEQRERDNEPQEEFMAGCAELASYKWRWKGDTIQTVQIPVVCVSLGFLNNFSDVYRLWLFFSKFLDPEFVKQELWHYQALNQETIEI